LSYRPIVLQKQDLQLQIEASEYQITEQTTAGSDPGDDPATNRSTKGVDEPETNQKIRVVSVGPMKIVLPEKARGATASSVWRSI
jgi:hypothetical protein